jgi:hypothetical protein
MNWPRFWDTVDDSGVYRLFYLMDPVLPIVLCGQRIPAADFSHWVLVRSADLTGRRCPCRLIKLEIGDGRDAGEGAP